MALGGCKMLRISYLFWSLKQHTFAHSPFNHDHDQQALSSHQPRVRPSSSFQIRGNNNPAHSGRDRKTRATLTTCNEVKIPSTPNFWKSKLIFTMASNGTNSHWGNVKCLVILVSICCSVIGTQDISYLSVGYVFWFHF